MKLLVVFLVLFSSVSYSQRRMPVMKKKDPDMNRDLNGVEFIRAVDGDTIEVNIRGAHPVFGHVLKIRIRDIDTPEMRTSDPCEKRLALLAKEFTHEFLDTRSPLSLSNPQRGTFFRVIADVKKLRFGRSSTYLTEELLKAKLAVPYSERKKVDWCALEKERNGE
jgi:micrococcal nuclease